MPNYNKTISSSPQAKEIYELQKQIDVIIGAISLISAGGVTPPPDTAYASNAAALAALGAGKIYKTTASINNTDDQPILSVTYNP
jgi:hypothetical protein